MINQKDRDRAKLISEDYNHHMNDETASDENDEKYLEDAIALGLSQVREEEKKELAEELSKFKSDIDRIISSFGKTLDVNSNTENKTAISGPLPELCRRIIYDVSAHQAAIKIASSNLQFWARRYAEGRQSSVCSDVNKLTEELIKLGVPCIPEACGERKGSIWAYDGDPRCCTAAKYEEKYGKDGLLKIGKI